MSSVVLFPDTSQLLLLHFVHQQRLPRVPRVARLNHLSCDLVHGEIGANPPPEDVVASRRHETHGSCLPAVDGADAGTGTPAAHVQASTALMARTISRRSLRGTQRNPTTDGHDSATIADVRETRGSNKACGASRRSTCARSNLTHVHRRSSCKSYAIEGCLGTRNGVWMCRPRLCHH